MKKLCTKKCKKCRGASCTNYYGFLTKLDKRMYYDGILNCRRPIFSSDIEELSKPPMDCSDWGLVYGLISLFVLLTIFGGVLI